jgi:2-amino-4-hydroxy-6-hydroxymethyldihydropteridine diphosphokinase
MEEQDRPHAPHLATVGIGSNLGDREAAVAGAIERLARRQGNRVRAMSSLYETEPLGKRDQAWFLNCVLQMETDQDLKDFFRALQETEAEFGRQRVERWGPRTLDLDLLLFDDTIHSDPELTIPHPGIVDRRFVLEPLCEIAPELVHPSLQLRMRDLLEGLRDTSRVVCLHRLPGK